MAKLDRRQFLKTAIATAGIMSEIPIAVLKADDPIQYADTIPSREYNARLGRHEKEVLKTFYDPINIYRFFCLEWHRRAHKTTLAINILIMEACKHHNSKYVYVAPTQVWAREVVWDDPTMLWSHLPKKDVMDWKQNEQKMLIRFANGSVLKIAGSDKPDALRGIDADGAALDEFALHKPETWTQIFRPIIAGPKKYPTSRDRWIIFTYTPKGINHATLMFDTAAKIESQDLLPTKGKAEKMKPGWFASRLIADESGIIAREELDKMLEEVSDGTLTQVEYDQEMQCRRVTEEERTFITSAMLDRLDRVQWEIYRDTAKEIRRIISIDPAFGGDVCAIKGFENGREILKRNIKNPNLRTNDIIREAKDVAQQLETKNFIVDCIGVGKGVADGLADDEAQYDVQYFDSAGKVHTEKGMSNIIADINLYGNKKAEAVAYCAGLIRRVEVENVVDQETRRQLVALSAYKVTRNGRTILISNDDVKKSIGRSPDDGLCWVYGQWGLQYVDPITNDAQIRYDEALKDTRARRRAKRRKKSPMRM